MLGTILEALAGAVIRWLSGWLEGRKLANETARADKAEAKDAQDEQIIKAEKDRADVDQEVVAAGTDAARDDMRNNWNEP